MSFSDAINYAEQAVRVAQLKLPNGHPDKVFAGGRVLSRPRYAALIGRQLLYEYRQKGLELMYFAWVAYRDMLWLDPNTTDPQQVDFGDFREWWNYVCDDPALGITRYSNLRTLAVSFATGLAPWLSQHRVIDTDGERLVPELFLERAGHGRIAEINGAWWSHFKGLEFLRMQLAQQYPGVDSREDLPIDEQNRLAYAEAETNNRMLTCVRLATDEGLTRERVGEKLEGLGWREKRGEEPDETERGWEHTIIPASDKTFVGVWVPNRWVDFFMKLAGKFLSVAPDRPDRILPEVIHDKAVSKSNTRRD